MRAAKEYLNGLSVGVEGQNTKGETCVEYEMIIKENVIEIINKARKETIEECAEKARTRTNDESTSIIVDKQSILSLIHELK